MEARSLALKRLAVREYSAAEMRSYLKRKNIPEDEADQVITDLVADHSIDDLRYARIIAGEQGKRDQGPKHVLIKLRQKGVDLPFREVERIFREVMEADELGLAREILSRRYPGFESDPRQRQRAYSALVRRGFSSSIASEVLKTDDQGQEGLE